MGQSQERSKAGLVAGVIALGGLALAGYMHFSADTAIHPVSEQTALDAYNQWKAQYVVTWNGNMARVTNPDDVSHGTASEGIGYGMLLSAFAHDEKTFSSLWNYAKGYLDNDGLMNWHVTREGVVNGVGSATDADGDIAYALIKANELWPNHGYDTAARQEIAAIKAHDITNNYVGPGDNWGNTQTMNPSYIAPSYYKVFADFTGDTSWNTIAQQNSEWLLARSDSTTGLLPDWVNRDGSSANFNSDMYQHDFYYDALRTSIRLLMDYKATGDQNAATILQKQNSFLESLGADKLTSGYTLSGQPLTNYLDTAFLASYSAASQIDPTSSFAHSMVDRLTNATPKGYYDSSLRAITLFIIAGEK